MTLELLGRQCDWHSAYS